MKNKSIIIGLITLFITLNCEAQWGKFNYEKGTDFTVYKTFAWHSGMDGIFDGSKMINIRNPENIQRIKNAIESKLMEKGFNKVDQSEAGMHLAFHGALERIADIEVTGYAVKAHAEFGRGTYGSHLSEQTYDIATLYIDVIDSKNNELVWRGWATDEVGKKVKEKQIKRAVSNILKKYPPKVK